MVLQFRVKIAAHRNADCGYATVMASRHQSKHICVLRKPTEQIDISDQLLFVESVFKIKERLKLIQVI